MKFEASKELTQYFKEVESTSGSLTKQEELTLIPLAKQGNQKALTRIINSCSKMVVKTANKYMGQGVPVIDLVQEGNMGTIEALNRFTPGKNRFSTYAQFWIKKYINDSVATVGKIVRLPMNHEFEIFKLKRAGKEVEEQVKISMDKKVSNDSETSIGDMYHFTQPEIESQHHDEFIRELVNRYLNKIKVAKDREILKAYFGIGRHCAPDGETIAKEFGMSKVGINKVVNKTLELLRG
jgi:RNA polymerase primary sigma factor